MIEGLVKENKVMLFMKGNKMFPQCGFSNSAVQVNRKTAVICCGSLYTCLFCLHGCFCESLPAEKGPFSVISGRRPFSPSLGSTRKLSRGHCCFSQLM